MKMLSRLVPLLALAALAAQGLATAAPARAPVKLPAPQATPASTTAEALPTALAARQGVAPAAARSGAKPAADAVHSDDRLADGDRFRYDSCGCIGS